MLPLLTAWSRHAPLAHGARFGDAACSSQYFFFGRCQLDHAIEEKEGQIAQLKEEIGKVGARG